MEVGRDALGMGRGIRVRELWVGGIWVREVWAGGIGVREGRSLHPNLLRTSGRTIRSGHSSRTSCIVRSENKIAVFPETRSIRPVSPSYFP